MTLPLALRRRFPLPAAAAVVAAFALGRIWLPIPEEEQYIVVWACWLALYSAAVHRRPGRRTGIALAVIAGVLVAEIVRELFFEETGLDDLPLTQWVLLAYNLAVLIALPLLLGLAVRALRQRQNNSPRRRRSYSASDTKTHDARCSKSGYASRVNCTTSSPTTSASWAFRPAPHGA